MQTPPIPIWANINTLRPRLRGYALVHVAFFNRHLLALQHCGSKTLGGDSTAILKAHELQVPICTTIMWGKWLAKLSRLGATCNYSAARPSFPIDFQTLPEQKRGSTCAAATQRACHAALAGFFFLHPVSSDMYAGSYDIHSYVFICFLIFHDILCTSC